ncbi:myosin regulatory light chain A, smooth adductor muscle-like isoform X2 [Ostrea edulis]|uniref:myosin regulatory light chain A, smooth adductor muscle-like isoform X2 n=1 Tax=Ostrea edulis TaxID=37623 RepID=UPI0024AF562F|nr:myosin regulatory light chain A, smooth adductor muscle-like isoform X2 [Ostrea edulis]XP_056004658.1 myosin regulatory light chain A, smooth adductor muscle-like isoform X2 [Ostrea edulis]
MQEMKEAFTMIDQNRDGFIDVNDLKEMFSSLGSAPDDKTLKAMLAEAPGPLNFTMFLSLFSDKLGGTDPEDSLKNAFAMFDVDGKGKIPEEYIKDLLENMGDNFTKDEMRQTFKEAPIEGGKLDYERFVQIIKGSSSEEA